MTVDAGLLRGLVICALLGLIARSAPSQMSVEIAFYNGVLYFLGEDGILRAAK